MVFCLLLTVIPSLPISLLLWNLTAVSSPVPLCPTISKVQGIPPPQSFSVPLVVSKAPTTLQVVPTGSGYQASAIALDITRLGDIPT